MTAQMYAIRSAIAKSIVAYYAKYVDESAKNVSWNETLWTNAGANMYILIICLRSSRNCAPLCWRTTGTSWSLTLVVASRRNMVDVVPVPDSRSLTVKLMLLGYNNTNTNLIYIA